MQICITQIDGVRYFSRFKNIPERDRLEIELTIEDGREKVFNFDLTDIMFEQFEKYPEILHRKRIVPKDDLLEGKPTRKRTQKASRPAPAVATVSPVLPTEATPKKNGRKRSVVPVTEEEPAKIDAVAEAPVKKTRAKKAEAKEETPATPKAPKKQLSAKSKTAATPKVADKPAQKPTVKAKAVLKAEKPAVKKQAAKKEDSAAGEKRVETAVKPDAKPKAKKAEVKPVAAQKVAKPKVSKPTATAKLKTPAPKAVKVTTKASSRA